MYKKPDFEPNMEEMFAIFQNNIPVNIKHEHLNVNKSCGRICAENVYAKHSLPNKPTSALDGIAVRFADFVAGMPDIRYWKNGQEYCFSNTGVAIAEEYDTVLAIEHISVAQNQIRGIKVAPHKQGQYVTAVGSQILEGELIFSQGRKITPVDIGLMMSAGVTTVAVLSKPVVAFIPTGDELVLAGGEVPLGKNIESNSAMLSAYIQEWGGEPWVFPIIQDNKVLLHKALLNAVECADLVLVCAGSSKGSKDFTIEVLDNLGQILIPELGYGPGKHCSLTMVNNVPVLGLPGPPKGADLAAVYCVRNAINLMQMQPIQIGATLVAKLARDVQGAKMDLLMSIHLTKKKGYYVATPLSGAGATRAQLNRLENAYFYVAKKSLYHAGQFVNVELKYPKEYIKEE